MYIYIWYIYGVCIYIHMVYIPLLYVQWKTPEDGQRNFPKHVEFYSKNIFEKVSATSWFYYNKFYLSILQSSDNSL